KLYLEHLQTDEDLIKFSSDVEKSKENKSSGRLSLNYEERKKEKQIDNEEENDTDENSLNGSTIKINNEFTTTEKDIKKLKKDPYLKESLRLLAAMAKLKV
ncbi:MAG: carboxy terminal-processing peptidase, partial [Cyclobacteriaceae bacterium]|nr:carboxy terminal-processing peptidase [Cyclobacteriaceae bacterium]